MIRRIKGSEVLAVAIVSALAGLFANEWIAAAALIVLWLGFKLLVTGDRIPVLFLAFLFQWMQVTCGLFYYAVVGREVPAIYLSDYRPMVLIGLGSILAIALGIRAGVALIRRGRDDLFAPQRFAAIMPLPTLMACYGIALVGEGTLLHLSQSYPSLRQIFTTLMVARMGLLFLVVRRLCAPVFRATPFALLLTFEVALGFTGFFAGFREPLILGALALIEIFDWRRAAHLVSLAAVLVVMIGASIVWMGVRNTYRRDFTEIDAFASSQSARIDRISSLGMGFLRSDTEDLLETVDALIDRMWVVYYPALAVARVPSVVPHTHGSILRAAVAHVLMPRALFPDKADLPSDSDMVREYSGVWVAGRNEGTSIAFGYSAEAYIDFGIPMMFVPCALFGLFIGVVYAWFVTHIWHREIAVAAVTVMFWLSLYLFERSSANMLGYAMSLFVYLGVPTLVVDRLLLARARAVQMPAYVAIEPLPGGDHVA
jgi:hypothetical protein